MVTIDAGERTYELVPDWGELKPNWTWGQVSDVAVDSKGHVHVFTKNTTPPYRVYDLSGKLLHSWGHGIFEDAHGVCIGPDDMVYLTDRGSHGCENSTPVSSRPTATSCSSPPTISCRRPSTAAADSWWRRFTT